MKRFFITICLGALTFVNVKAQSRINIYGGKNHDQFLGCINCSDQSINSIWCGFGDFGSTHKPKSIWNKQGKFGSKKSDYSPYNPKAKYPPLIIDEKGRTLGYLTINKNNPKRTRDEFAQMITEHRDHIIEDIPEFYKGYHYRFYD